MPIHNKSKKQIPPIKGGQVNLNGFESFKKSLEKDFFSDCDTICSIDKDGVTINIVISLCCNLTLSEGLFHVNNGNWGGLLSENDETSKFEKAVEELILKNDNLEITEFCINFKDTSVIISKIYPGSIPDYLGIILPAISENLVHFTRGLTEIPFEIFVPVFADQESILERYQKSSKEKSLLHKGYFDYWGLYFDSNAHKDPVIYNVKTKKITEEDFFLLDY
jgi:hypothetical protein